MKAQLRATTKQKLKLNASPAEKSQKLAEIAQAKAQQGGADAVVSNSNNSLLSKTTM
ncbi:hypothetical protein ACOBV8_20300 (plasmid) [Pseudoalteromonas espejiana]